MGNLDTEISILVEKLAELREKSTRWKNFELPTSVTTHIKDRVREFDVDEANFSEEFQDKGKSLTLTVHHVNIRKPLQKSLQDNISETRIKMPEPVPVFTEVRNIFPNLIYARKKERLRVTNNSDLAFVQENIAKIHKTFLFPLG
jgi:hypothetical protein